MKVINPYYKILTRIHGMDMLRSIESAGRVCYKSEDKITEDSCLKFVDSVIKRGHESVIEHQSISVLVVCDRGVSHEIVRHRIASYSQESTRYCNYCNDKFFGSIVLIHPPGLTEEQIKRREAHFWDVQRLYDKEIEEGVRPQIARGVLPTALKTEIVMTMNLREWRHFFKLRTAWAAHPQMREITIPMLADFKRLIPIVFNDVKVEESIVY